MSMIGVPGDPVFFPPVGETSTIPARAFGFEVGAHVYPFSLGPARLGIGAAGGDVVQDPLVVAALFVDVFVQRRAQPVVAGGQSGLRRLEQRHRVAHMVVGLAQEGQVAGQGHFAAQAALDDGRGQQALARIGALLQQLFVEAHEWGQTVISQARQAGRKIGICGQAPSDYPEFAEFLVREGIDSISLNPDVVLKTTRQIAGLEQSLQSLGS